MNFNYFIFLCFTTIFAQTCNNNCITFLVGEGTGCQWMCDYCATQLNSSNYFFLPPVCTYQSGGCVGDPQPGVSYSCCTTS